MTHHSLVLLVVEWLGDGLGLGVQPCVDEESVHVRAQQGRAHQVREAQGVDLRASDEPGGEREGGWVMRWHAEVRGEERGRVGLVQGVR